MSNLRLDGMQFGRRRSLYLPWLYHNKLEGHQLVKGLSFWEWEAPSLKEDHFLVLGGP